MDDFLDSMVSSKQLAVADAALLRDRIGDAEDSPYQDEESVLKWVAEEYDVPFTDLSDVEPDHELLSLFPARVLLKREILPIRRVNGGVEVAISQLFATEGLDTLKTLTGLRLRPVLAPSAAIQREMKRRLGVGADTLDSIDEEASIQVIDEDADDDINLEDAAEDASIITFVNQVMSDAIALRATDIHVEPFENELRIRYRIDGVLQDVPVPSQIKRYQPAIVSRIKILSHLDIAEKRLPQDGRIKVRLEKNDVDVRVSLIPMLHGEAVVMRLLQQSAALSGLAPLMMGEHEQRVFRGLLDMPHGIVLVTGPTGSGKTTTLYAALNEINDAVRKIITIEDPVEYNMRGINQIQVSEKSGLTFARGLRSVLRHDPDVILVGEIRDTETAQIAVQASLTGHLVFSTLHTNDAPGALNRLVDMHVEPYLVASALEAVLAQRLVRVLCPECKEEDRSTRALSFRSKVELPEDRPLYKAVGCEACRGTGYYGRRGLFELMQLNEPLRALLLSAHTTGEIRDLAKRHGLRTLSEDGWRVVAEGATTVDEVLRVTKDERHDGSDTLDAFHAGQEGSA